MSSRQVASDPLTPVPSGGRDLLLAPSALIVGKLLRGGPIFPVAPFFGSSAVFTQIATCHNGIRLLWRLQQPKRGMGVP